MPLATGRRTEDFARCVEVGNDLAFLRGDLQFLVHAESCVGFERPGLRANCIEWSAHERHRSMLALERIRLSLLDRFVVCQYRLLQCGEIDASAHTEFRPTRTPMKHRMFIEGPD